MTDDPSLPGPFAGSIGRHDYALAAIDVPNTDAGPTPTDSLPLTATVRYPAVASGVDAAVAAGSFPLVVIMHGNSGMETSYLGYNYLLDHLAGHGFIALSIYAPVGAFIETRARAILAHLGIMSQANSDPGLFHGHVDLSAVGIAGHSRGGEAVVRAARINTSEGLGYAFKAGISIAPTDYFHYGAAGIPLTVIYGANDGDVAGTWPDRTGFDIFDETARPRSFVLVYGATHDRFNSEWASIEASTELTGTSPRATSRTGSRSPTTKTAKGYVTAFSRRTCRPGRTARLLPDGQAKPHQRTRITTHEDPGANRGRFRATSARPDVELARGAVTTTALPTSTEGAPHARRPFAPHHLRRGDRVAVKSGRLPQSDPGREPRRLGLFRARVSGDANLWQRPQPGRTSTRLLRPRNRRRRQVARDPLQQLHRHPLSLRARRGRSDQVGVEECARTTRLVHDREPRRRRRGHHQHRVDLIRIRRRRQWRDQRSTISKFTREATVTVHQLELTGFDAETVLLPDENGDAVEASGSPSTARPFHNGPLLPSCGSARRVPSG